MYKAAVRWMIRRNIDKLNEGDHGPVLAMFSPDATLRFPGDNTFSNQFRTVDREGSGATTHRGKAEIEAFLDLYDAQHITMIVDDILVNGPPWRTRAAVRVHHWIDGDDGGRLYDNRAVMFVETSWGRIRAQEDYEDTDRVADYEMRIGLREVASSPA